MNVELLAFDSMGVRSMCTFVETDDVKITIDPGISLAPMRYGLPPHRLELDRLKELAKVITDRAKKSDLVVITHYHYDHHDLGDAIPFEVYEGKTVLLKDPEHNINKSQGDFRAPLFLGIIRERAKEIEAADGRIFTFGGTRLEFSKAVFHGSSSLLGYVIEVMVESDGKRVIHTSDVQGPIYEDQTEFPLRTKPDLVIADGPMTYMLGYRYSHENLEAALNNIRRLLKNGLKELVLDHHFMRHLNYQQYLKGVEEEFPEARVLTAAEYMGEENNLLEAKRRELYSSEGRR
ncbi:MAG: MBL fold metallo-hydrolase [Candidatus Verstraetearchaeota archaeon]|nr:MBL fold metallo-hydrolase [Candidatus Verstraetearchaeota archaeon]